MDLQKIAAQANAASSQRPEGASQGTGMFATPFADMIRLPLLMASDMLAAKDGKKATLDPPAETNKKIDKPDNQQSDNGEDRQVSARDDVRDDDMHVGNQDDDGSDDTMPRPEDSHDNTDGEQDTAHGENDDAPQQASADEDTDSGGPEETSDTDDTTTDARPEQEAADTDAGDQSSDGVVVTSAIFEPALDALIAAAHTAQTNGAPKDAAQNVRDAAAGAKSATTAGTGAATNVEKSTVGDDQTKQSQQAQNTLERVGTQAASNAAAAAKAAAVQPLVELQAKALADSLKSNTPVKVEVSVDNRAGTAVSQTSQSLNANTVAAQEISDGKSAVANIARPGTADGSQQAAQARVEGGAGTPGQALALAQLTQNNGSAAAETGLNRATLQVTTTGPQAPHGGGEGANVTTPTGVTTTQQASTALRAQQAPTTNAPGQARPLAQQISVNISKAVSEGLDRISIQLRPDNLGRVEVKLEVSQNGRVNATIIADRPEALELLRNDSRNLERALQDAGLDTQSGDLNFSLRDQQENPSDSQPENRMANGSDNTEDGDVEAEMATRLLNGELGDIISDMHVDIRA